MQLKNKRMLRGAMYAVFTTVLIFAAGEIILQMKGYKPWKGRELDIIVEPGGRLVTENRALGYTHRPGRYKVTLHNSPYSFTVTHLDNTLRITHPLDTYNQKSDKKEIWIFGCSLTHGWSVNDNDTYPWLLQEKLPDYEVVNFGVSGYGTVHSLIQLEDALREGRKPAIVVLAYASFHDERNTFCRARRKSVLNRDRLEKLAQPYAKTDRQGKLHYYTGCEAYNEVPLSRHSAFVHWLENQYNRAERKLQGGHEVSKALIRRMSGVCGANGIKFAVAGIWPHRITYDMLEYCKKNGIAAIDISVTQNLRTTNYPYDGHPGPMSHRIYAAKLTRFLARELNNPDSDM